MQIPPFARIINSSRPSATSSPPPPPSPPVPSSWSSISSCCRREARTWQEVNLCPTSHGDAFITVCPRQRSLPPPPPAPSPPLPYQPESSREALNSDWLKEKKDYMKKSDVGLILVETVSAPPTGVMSAMASGWSWNRNRPLATWDRTPGRWEDVCVSQPEEVLTPSAGRWWNRTSDDCSHIVYVYLHSNRKAGGRSCPTRPVFSQSRPAAPHSSINSRLQTPPVASSRSCGCPVAHSDGPARQ